VLYPGGAQRQIDEQGPVAHQVLDRLVRLEALAQQLRAAVEYLAKGERRMLTALQGLRHEGQIGPISVV
jgi:hypothetical protein